jgi:biopolymer transport protein ExbD
VSALRGAVMVACLAGCETPGEAGLQAPPTPTVEHTSSFRVAIADDGTLRLDGAPVDLASLATTAQMRRVPRARVRISPAVSFRRLGEVVETLREAGMDVSFEVRLHRDD